MEKQKWSPKKYIGIETSEASSDIRDKGKGVDQGILMHNVFYSLYVEENLNNAPSKQTSKYQYALNILRYGTQPLNEDNFIYLIEKREKLQPKS